MRTSPHSRLLPPLITLLGFNREFSSAEATLRKVAQQQLRPEPFAPPRALDRSVDISVHRPYGWPVYTVRPKRGRTQRRVLYVHGGAWIHEISPYHWRLVACLASAAGSEFTVPIYPLAPVGTAGAVVPEIADLAAGLVAAAGPENVTLMGDSAGGTIALAAAMTLRDRGIPSPAELVLISPALDLTLTDPGIARIQPRDPWLAVPGLRAAIDLWRGDLPVEDPLVSPIFGSLAGLGRITLFTAGRDITNADAATLVRRARDESHPLDVHEEAHLVHVHPLLPIPEGARARRAIADVLRR
ncbi:alpha/beta hydrolase fold domain-containing protein [Naasia sp. SYSU D00948]|uniref:alpha/beta hydrolase fold domain-containing protein n=1 Tax=Naasia sp. SYSU D00948 TaxID=2817379 RepID=UPI001FEEE58E|nr:alpha/beta hydrolase [Naasia sp. SYSU D00948]